MRKITSSLVKLYRECPRCAYLLLVAGIKRPKSANKNPLGNLIKASNLIPLEKTNRETEIDEKTAWEIEMMREKGIMPKAGKKCRYCRYAQKVEEYKNSQY